MTDFLVAFDHNTAKSKNYSLEFEIFSEIASNIKLTGEFQFTTKTASIEGNSIDKSVQTNQTYKYLENGKKFLGKVPTEADLKKNFDKINTAFDTLNWKSCKKLATALEKANTSLQNGDLKKFLLGATNVASGISGGLGIITSVLDIFIGKSNANAIQTVQIQPTISNGTITLKGSIETKSNSARYSLQLPSTNHQYPDGSINYDGFPVYDCPLGLIGLEYTPKLKVRTIKQYKGSRCIAWNQRRECIKEIEVYQTHKSYKFDDNISLAINQSSKVRIISAKAQLINKPKENVFVADLWSSKNFTRELLENSTYQIVAYDSLNRHKFATPFIDISNFRNTAFTTEPNADLFLKLLVVLEPTEEYADKSPIVFSVTYNLDNFEVENSSASDGVFEITDKNKNYNIYDYPFTFHQLYEKEKNTVLADVSNSNNNLSSNYIETSGTINILPSNADITYQASESIVLKSGTTIGTSNGYSFTAKINKSLLGINGENALVVHEYFANCDCYPPQLQNAKSFNGTSKTCEPVIQNLTLSLFPNPANDFIAIQIGNANFPANVRVFDSQGQMKEFQSLNGYDFKLDISNYSKGLYFVKVIDCKASVTSKFIKQ